MATVESTEIGICADGRDLWYKVVFTDASDTSIMANGTGVTVTGSVSGAKTATPIKIPRVEIRNTKTVVSGFLRIDNDNFIPWYGLTHETVTVDAAAGGLFSAEVGATESAALVALDITGQNRSRVDLSGNTIANPRRTRFKAGAVPSGFSVAPVLTFDADAETHADGATVAITDQVSGLTTRFNNGATSTNAFTWRQSRYGTGRNAIELAVNESIRNTVAIDQSGGYTMHWVEEFVGPTASPYIQYLDGGSGLVQDFTRRKYIRIPLGAALSPLSRDGFVYATRSGSLVLHTLVVYANGDRRHFVNGRSYDGKNLAAPAGTFTNKELIRRVGGTGFCWVRRLDIITSPLTEDQVYADHDYFANVIYADDEDLNGSLVCYVDGSAGSPSGSGRYNDPVDAINGTTMGGGSNGWLNVNTVASYRKDVGLVLKNGTTCDIVPSIAVNGTNEDPHFPFFIGREAKPTALSPQPILNYVDQASGAAQTVFSIQQTDEANEFCFFGVEITSLSRNYRSGGTATVADSEDTEVTFVRTLGAGIVGLQFIECPFSQLSHLITDNTAGSLTGQNWTSRNYELWRSPCRNNYTRTSTQGTSGSQEAATLFLSKVEQVWVKDFVGYECGWDPDVVRSAATLYLWNGAAFDAPAALTDRPALDNGYSRFAYCSEAYGAVLFENIGNIRDASHDIQFREGGMVDTFLRWESAGAMFWSDHDSYGANLLSEGHRQITGGNLIGFRGPQFSTGGADAPRLIVLKNVLINQAGAASTFPGIQFDSARAVSTYAPTGTANIRAENMTVAGFNKGIRFDYDTALLGYVRRSIVDLTGSASPSTVVEFDNTGSMVGFDITGIAYDLDSATASTAWDYNEVAGTLATLRSSSGMSVDPVIDLTSTGLGYTKRTLTQWCQTVHGFTKVDGGQTEAEELGEQWYEAFADAIRTGGDPSPYFASAAIDWVFAGWAPDLASQAAIEAVDPGEYWGAYDYRSGPPMPSPRFIDARGIMQRQRVAQRRRLESQANPKTGN